MLSKGQWMIFVEKWFSRPKCCMQCSDCCMFSLDRAIIIWTLKQNMSLANTHNIKYCILLYRKYMNSYDWTLHYLRDVYRNCQQIIRKVIACFVPCEIVPIFGCHFSANELIIHEDSEVTISQNTDWSDRGEHILFSECKTTLNHVTQIAQIALD